MPLSLVDLEVIPHKDSQPLETISSLTVKSFRVAFANWAIACFDFAFLK
jgi:hypothetical protein